MITALKVLPGMYGQLELYPDRIIIKRKGFSAVMRHGFKGDKALTVHTFLAKL